MSGDYGRLKELFFAALERPAAERGPFLEAVCAGDADLHARLSGLLEAAREGDGFLEVPPELPADPSDGLAAGARLGPWEIVREIGRGGMGAVYEARRAEGDFTRRTAVKVVRPEIATPFFVERFRKERRILAGLDHPHIARLIDAGAASDGLPYVVLEYVEGEPLLDHCAARGLGVVERLRLFRQICAAVDYAHRNLVVHRDLKPSNILVTAEGVPKLLDFGIAKLLEPETGSGPQATMTQLHLLTPEYASPEQFGGGRITTATDVYSLGVVLYELLTGRRPFYFGTSDPREIARLVGELQPPKPSVRVTRPEPEPASVKPPPGTPGKLARRLRGDLDTIVMTAMRKEPDRRYASVGALSEDVLRHLEGRPILARKDTLGYRSSRFVRRHRAGVAAGFLVAAALAAGFVMTLHQKRVAEFERARAERRFNDVRKLAGSFLFEFHDAIQNLPGSTPARSLVVKRALQYLDSLSAESASDPGLRRELASAYQKVGEVQGEAGSANLGDTRGALRSFRKALAMREALARESPGNAELAQELGATLDSLGSTLTQTGNTAAAFDTYRRALEVREKIVAADPHGVVPRRALATSYHHIAEGLVDRGEYRQALSVWRKESELFENLWKENPADKRAQRNVALGYKYLGGTLERLGNHAEALELYTRAVALDEARSAADPTGAQARIDLSFSYGARAICLLNLKDVEGALTTYRKAFAIREALAEADPKNANAQGALARAYLRIGEILEKKPDPAAALASYRKALAIEEIRSKSDPSNEVARVAVAVALSHQARAETLLAAARTTPIASRASHWREARATYRKSLELWVDMRSRGVLSGTNSGEPARVAQQIALCDEALRKK
jgi:non-specific serine/threonine protein kinase/serine/threonine-protein kinase